MDFQIQNQTLFSEVCLWLFKGSSFRSKFLRVQNFLPWAHKWNFGKNEGSEKPSYIVANFFKPLDFQRSEFRISIYVSIGGKVEILQLLFDLGRSGNLWKCIILNKKQIDLTLLGVKLRVKSLKGLGLGLKASEVRVKNLRGLA